MKASLPWWVFCEAGDPPRWPLKATITRGHLENPDEGVGRVTSTPGCVLRSWERWAGEAEAQGEMSANAACITAGEQKVKPCDITFDYTKKTNPAFNFLRWRL